MLNQLYFNHGHLTALAFLMLETGELSQDEKSQILFHLSECDECMQSYVDSLTETSLIEPPAELEANIIQAVVSENDKKRTSKVLSIQFVKLGIAVCITMVMFFGGVFEFIGDMPIKMAENTTQKEDTPNALFEFTNSISDSFNKFAFSFNSSMHPDSTEKFKSSNDKNSKK